MGFNCPACNVWGEYYIRLASQIVNGLLLFASFVGTITPLLLSRFGFNPALAAGPFITTVNDLLGLTVYFLTVRIFLI